jgi:multicomponent K+:H+ antiporter subunit G
MNEGAELPFWLELITAVLLLTGSVFALIGALGLVRLKDFFQHRSSISRGSSRARCCMPG